MTDTTNANTTDEQEQSQADSTNAANGNQQQNGQRQDASRSQQNGDQNESNDAREVKDLPAWAQKQIRDLRKEAGDYRKKAQDYEDRDKTELEKAQAAAKRFEDEAKKLAGDVLNFRAESSVRDAAEKAGARNPSRIFRLVKDDLELDDDGKVTNLDAVIKDAKREMPELFGQRGGGADGGKGGREQSGTGMNALIRQKAGYER